MNVEPKSASNCRSPPLPNYRQTGVHNSKLQRAILKEGAQESSKQINIPGHRALVQTSSSDELKEEEEEEEGEEGWHEEEEHILERWESRPSAVSLTEKRTSKMRLIPMKQSLKTDVLKTAAWVFVAVVAAAAMWHIKGRDSSLEFVTGYIVEYSLSVDNLFVFLLIFRYFKVPREVQERVLFLGILGAMVLRGIMIVFGEWLTKRFEWVTLFFAALLLYSAAKLLLENDDEDENLDNNRIVRFSKRVVPLSDRYHGDQFFVVENARLLATPLMVVLISIELSDVVFAMDSVPAVLGISKDPYVIYPSNILAVMGLRSLFFVISDAISELRFLKQSLALVLGFVGVKMIAAFMGKNLGVIASLMFVVCTLAIGITLSLMFPSPSPQSSTNTDGIPMTIRDQHRTLEMV